MAEVWLPANCTRQFNTSYLSSPVGKSLTFRNISVPRRSIPFQCFSLLVQKYRRLSSIFSWQQRQQMTAYITRWQSSMAAVCSFSLLARKFTPQILRSSRYTINSHHFRKGSPIANTFQRAFSLQRWEIKLFTAFRPSELMPLFMHEIYLRISVKVWASLTSLHFKRHRELINNMKWSFLGSSIL